MAKEKVTLTLDSENLRALRELVGSRSLSKFVDRAVAAHLEHARHLAAVDAWLAELEEEHGPIPTETLHWAARLVEDWAENPVLIGTYFCEQAQYYWNEFPKAPDPDPEDPFDHEGWPRCTRKCLQDCDDAIRPQQDSCPPKPAKETESFWSTRHFSCHAICYIACAIDQPAVR